MKPPQIDADDFSRRFSLRASGAREYPALG
jgi:hypothetical protein